MLIGYCRTSTVEQQAGLAAQERDVKAAGAERVYSEQVSSVATRRRQLEAALDFAREGDVLVVSKLDRLARSTANLLEVIARLEAKRVALIVLSVNGQGTVDTRTATGKLMLTLLGAFAQFERELMLERQREGVAKAKADGKYKGRAPTVRKRSAEILSLRAEGVGTVEIARRLGVNRVSVHRVLVAERAKQEAA